MRNPKESSNCPEATVGLNRGQLVVHRRLKNRRYSSFQIIYNFVLQLRSSTPLYDTILPTTTVSPSTTPVYNSALLQPRRTPPAPRTPPAEA
jgi:hypothetical protein